MKKKARFCEQDRLNRLGELLTDVIERKFDSKVMIFTETKKGADNLTRALRYERIPALAIHGDKKQEERDYVFFDFRKVTDN